eukprot:180118_1
MLLINSMLLISAITVVTALRYYQLYNTDKISNIASAILSFSTLIDILFTFSSIGTINENELIEQMNTLYSYECYQEESYDSIINAENCIKGILTFDSLGVVLDFIGLVVLFYMIAKYYDNHDENSRKLIHIAQLVHMISFLLKFVFTFVNVASYAIPSHRSLMHVYNNHNALCYHAKNGENFDVETHQLVVNILGIFFTVVGIISCTLLGIKQMVDSNKNQGDNNNQDDKNKNAKHCEGKTIELSNWIQSMDLEKQWKDQILKETKESTLTIDDFKSLESAQDVANSFKIENEEITAKIFAQIKSIKDDNNDSGVTTLKENNNVNSEEFKISMFVQEEVIVLDELVRKTDKVEKIKILYQSQSGTFANIEEIHLYSKGKLLPPEDTLEKVGIIDDRNLITVKFDTGAGGEYED